MITLKEYDCKYNGNSKGANIKLVYWEPSNNEGRFWVKIETYTSEAFQTLVDGIEEYIWDSSDVSGGSVNMALRDGYEHFICGLCGLCARKKNSNLCGTGYAQCTKSETLALPHGAKLTIPEGKICYECVARWDTAYMFTHGKNGLYLKGHKDIDGTLHDCVVTNWPGSLSIPCRVISRSRNNMGAQRIDVRFKFQGAEWTGTNIGDNDIVRCKRMAKQKKQYEIICHGVDHAQYFQGCGVAHTKYNFVATGCGDNAVEAYNDALEQIAMSHTGAIEALGLPDRPHGYGIDKRNKVPTEHSKHEDNEMYFYVSIRYNLPASIILAE